MDIIKKFAEKGNEKKMQTVLWYVFGADSSQISIKVDENGLAWVNAMDFCKFLEVQAAKWYALCVLRLPSYMKKDLIFMNVCGLFYTIMVCKNPVGNGKIWKAKQRIIHSIENYEGLGEKKEKIIEFIKSGSIIQLKNDEIWEKSLKT